MRIEVLGCSGGIGPGLRTTSLMLDGQTLIDAGTGVGDLEPAAARNIRRVLLTHAHLDHVCGLAFLADNLFSVIDRPIEVLARGETIEALRRHLFNWTLWPDFTRIPSERTPTLQLRSIEPGTAIDPIGEVGVSSFEVCHTVPSLGYVLQGPAATFAFTGDTGTCPRLWRALNALPKLDLLMIDVAFPDQEAELGELAKHYTPASLARDLGELRHRPQLLLTHHKPGNEAELLAQCAETLQGWSIRHLRRGDVIEI